MQRQSRPAFTLLEVLLASAIGVLLMAALYQAMSVQFQHAQEGRDLVEQGTLARSLLARISSDISAALCPVESDSSSTQSLSSLSGEVKVNVGVQGEANRLILYISRVPRELNWGSPGETAADVPTGVCDQRRICYWLVGSGDPPLGLARQELKLVNSEEALTSLPPDIPDAESYIMAEEVKSLTFNYFNGSWQDSWNSSLSGSDSTTSQGPPLAIAIELGIGSPGSANWRTYRHVVSIPSGSGGGSTDSSTDLSSSTSNPASSSSGNASSSSGNKGG